MRSSVLIVESLKKRILQKKLHEFKNYLFNQPAVLEVQPTYDIQITRPQKQKKDSSVQISPKKEIIRSKKEKSQNPKNLKGQKNIKLNWMMAFRNQKQLQN